MKKTFLLGFSALILIGIGFYYYDQNRDVASATAQTSQSEQAAFDGKNSSFTIDNKPIKLVNGVLEEPIENSSAKIITNYIGYAASGDLNGDGAEDHAFWITQSTGGSGTFYYVVAALKDGESYKTGNAFYIGDRISPESTQIRADVHELHLNYADRKQDEPMTAQPSQQKTLLLKVSPNGELEGLMR